MSSHLVITLHLHDARYHGAAEWPPAPARLFQALLAGAARGTRVPDGVAEGLRWLETLPPPVIAAPLAQRGQQVDLFVPNNDADTVGGDPARVSGLRVKKPVRPRLLGGDALLYAWPLPERREHASTVILAADELYQLGRGLDMAWATGEVLEDQQLEARLVAHRGTLHRPSSGDGTALACPTPGSYDGLVERHLASTMRFREEGAGKSARVLFVQPPKPRFVPVVYDAGARRFVYELRDRETPTRLWPWPVTRVVTLIERIRDRAAQRLRDAMPELADVVDRVIIGRGDDGHSVPIAQRVRIVPLPSIGSEYVDPAIRRIAVEVPSESPLAARDVAWAFSGLETNHPDTGIVDVFTLVDASDLGMLTHYGVETASRAWRSITPVAVPVESQRRRIEPARQRQESKPAAERVQEEHRAVGAIRAALRHAGVRALLLHAYVRREPAHDRGSRVEAFATETRFAKERLWHVELELASPVRGPLVIGDGRFLGLGVLAPSDGEPGILGFQLSPAAVRPEDGIALARAMRRAILARVQSALGREAIPAYISGHEADGTPLQTDAANHIAVQWDGERGRLLVIPPHVQERRRATAVERSHYRVLQAALVELTDLKAGVIGRFHLTACGESDLVEYTRHSKTWESANPYTITRHPRRASAGDALILDVAAQCARYGLPRPEVTVRQARGVSGRGLEGLIRLEFPRAVPGPVLLGRTRYLGGGLFLPG